MYWEIKSRVLVQCVFTLLLNYVPTPNLLTSSNKPLLLQTRFQPSLMELWHAGVFLSLLCIPFEASRQLSCKLNSQLCVYLGKDGHKGLPALSEDDSEADRSSEIQWIQGLLMKIEVALLTLRRSGSKRTLKKTKLHFLTPGHFQPEASVRKNK